MNSEVYVYRYATKGTFDAYMWSIVENKQKFIAQIMTNQLVSRTCENVDAAALSYAEIKAIATGNPLIKEKMEVDAEVSRLQTLKSDYQNRRFRLQSDVSTSLPRQIAQISGQTERITNDIILRDSTKDADFTITIMDRQFCADMEHAKEQAGEALIKAAQISKDGDCIGEYRGFSIIRSSKASQQNLFIPEARLILQGSYSYETDMGDSALGNITRLDNTLKNLDALKENRELHCAKLRQEMENAKHGLEDPFEHEGRLQSLLVRQLELNTALDLSRPDEVFVDDSRELADADTEYLEADDDELGMDEAEPD